MEKRIFKDTIYGAIAGMSKAFSHANRLEIIDLLANGEKTVEQIAVQTHISVANASQHLQILKVARLVKKRREGNFIWYTLSAPQVYAAWKAFRDLAVQQNPAIPAMVRQFHANMNSAEVMSFTASPTGKPVFLLDVRPADEFAAGHLPGACSIPISELAQRMPELPRDNTIVTYCRGAFCTYADEAVQLLHTNGFHAVRLAENYLDVKFGCN
jgi:rhodanese-related sulfurtransferase/DNA-binding transcriptional ArsR family regulator